MNVVERELTHLGEDRPLKVVAVQLISPFTNGELELQKFYKWISWKSVEAEAARRDRVLAVLETLKNRDHDILVFPEYSVPESLHDDDIFQDHANTKRCIVVPGTFSPTQATSKFASHVRDNLCRIYLPDDEPILLAKNALHPDEEEFVHPRPELPNSARLLWRRQDGQQVSINIFICRDYLKPFAKTSDNQMVSRLDWDREGLNIVLMESKEANVFLGRAAAEIRRLRGPGKVILLSNSARNGGELATALIGPSPNRKMEFGDVVESVPADSEGILSSDISLSDVHYTVTRPDTTVRSPIQNSRIDLFSLETGNTIQFKPLPKHGPRLRRGIWHPSLLAALEKKIVIDFYQSDRLRPVRENFKSRISSVYAAIIRGYDDLMIRRYDKEIDRKLTYPFSNLKMEEQITVFGENSATIWVEPTAILKYRGHKFDGSSWDRERKVVADLFADERMKNARIDAIAALAEDWDDPQIAEEIRKSVAVAFDNRAEATIPLDQDVQNGIRETYVLIGIPNQKDHKSFRDSVLEKLLDDESVREVFYPISSLRGLSFQCLLKMKCTQGKSDEIVLRMRDQGEEEGYTIWTRTFAVIEYLQKESVSGLAGANVTAEVKAFFEALQKTDLEASQTLNLRSKTEQFLLLAAAYGRQRILPAALAHELGEYLARFYSNLYFGNFLPVTTSRRESYLQMAHNNFSNLFQHLERNAERKMSEVLKVDPSEIVEAMKRERPKALAGDESNFPLELMLRAPDLFVGEMNDAFRRARTLRKPVGKVRNFASHGSMNQYNVLNISSGDWQAKCSALLTITSELMNMIEIVDMAKAPRS